MSSPLLVLHNKLVNEIKENPEKGKNLTLKIQRLNHSVQIGFIQRHEEGYCARFIIPDRDFNNIFSDFKTLDNKEIGDAFRAAWKLPPNGAHMHSNIYYQKLCLVAYYAAITDDDELGQLALRLILFRVWNGRITKLIKWCNPEIMAAAIANCKSRKFEFKKHATPLDLIQNYLAPTIWNKYKPYLLDSVDQTKRIFEQCFQRIKQMFGSGARKDLKTGETRYQSGLQPFYYRAYEERNKISSGNNNSESDFDNVVTSSEIENLTTNVITYITLFEQEYTDEFLDIVVDKVIGIKKYKIKAMMEKIHQIKYSDLLRDIVELFFRKMQGLDRNQYCTPDFYNLIKNKIIASKNNEDIENLKKVVDILIDGIFKNDLDKVYDNYMDKTINQKSQYRNIIIFAIAFNIKSVICQN